MDQDLIELVLDRIRLELSKQSLQRNVDMVVWVLDFDALKLFLIQLLVRENANHGEPLPVDLDLLSYGLIQAKEFAPRRSSEHTELAGISVVDG